MNDVDLTRLDLNLLVVFDVLMREGNVTRAAKQLGRTQSAVSHSLGRLRAQLGDPLMIKSGGRMVSTPYALKLAEDLRPILRNVQQIVAGPELFDPTTSRRSFRVAIPAASSAFMADVMGRVFRQAPGVAVDWLNPDADAFAKVAAGLIDIVAIGGERDDTEGIEVLEGEPQTWMTYARKDHPATDHWGLDAWQKWPHVMLKVATRAQSPVDEVARGAGLHRTIGAWVTSLSSIPPLLLRTDMLATFPPTFVSEGLDRMGLCALEPPVPIPAMPMRFMWSRRLSNDPGSRWFRAIVVDAFRAQSQAGHRSISTEGVIKPATRGGKARPRPARRSTGKRRA